MSIFFDSLANQCFINQVKKEIGRDVVFFSLDGITYFGNLQAVGNNGIAVLVPATLSSYNVVEIRNPSELGVIENHQKIYP